MKGDKRKNQRTYEYLSTKENGEQLWICDAIEWADETMIDKACEWLKSFLEGPMGEGLAKSITEEFRKAMEE